MQRRTLLGSIGVLAAWLGGRAAAQSVGTRIAGAAGQPDIAVARARMLAALPYRRVTVSGAAAMAEWTRLRDEGQGWPVIIGDDEQLEAIAEQFSIDDPSVFPVPAGAKAPPPPRTPAEILAAADKMKLPDDMRKRFGDLGEVEAPAIGDWPADTAGGDGPGLTVALDLLSGKPFDKVHILILPTRDSAEAPAYLRWGNWNECPTPELHVAALRDWKRRYGVELVGIDRDTMNLLASRLPGTRADALALAREHYDYCSDIVDQGVETLSALAAGLMVEKWWFFWWD